MSHQGDAHIPGRSSKGSDFFDPIDGGSPPCVNDNVNAFMHKKNPSDECGTTGNTSVHHSAFTSFVARPSHVSKIVDYGPVVTNSNSVGHDENLTKFQLNGHMDLFNGNINGKVDNTRLEDDLDDYQDSEESNAMEVDGIENQLSALLVETSDRAELEHLMVDVSEIDDKSAFFKENKKYFVCLQCNELFKGDGYANNSYRLRCKCGTTSIAKALQEIQIQIEYRFPGEDVEMGSVAGPESRAASPTVDSDPEPLKENDKLVNEARLERGSYGPETIKPADKQLEAVAMLMDRIVMLEKNHNILEDKCSSLKAEIWTMKTGLACTKEENLRLRLENDQLKTRLQSGLKNTESIMVGPITTYDSKKKEIETNKTPTFADLSRALPKAQTKSTNNYPGIKTPEEFARFFRGQPIKAPRDVKS